MLQEYFWDGNIWIGFLDWIWLMFVDLLRMTDDWLLRTDDWGQGNENNRPRIKNMNFKLRSVNLWLKTNNLGDQDSGHMTEDGGLGTHLRLYQLGQTVVNAYPALLFPNKLPKSANYSPSLPKASETSGRRPDHALGFALGGCLDPPPFPPGPLSRGTSCGYWCYYLHTSGCW